MMPIISSCFLSSLMLENWKADGGGVLAQGDSGGKRTDGTLASSFSP